MALNLKTPGVYIEEKSAFPNSVVGVETAIPAFVGYTQKAKFKGESLLNKPVKIDSFKEFEQFYGAGCKTTYGLTEIDTSKEDAPEPDLHLEDKAYTLDADVGTRFNLYESLKFFYQNGGGTCFIVAVGTYDKGVVTPDFSTSPFEAGIKKLEKETEPTMLVIPDAVLLDDSDCYSLQQQMLMHCGKQQNRVSILDVTQGDRGLDDPTFNPVDNFRNAVASDYLSYGAAYYPYLHTTIMQLPEISFQNLNADGVKVLQGVCNDFAGTLGDAQKTAIKPYIDGMGAAPADAGGDDAGDGGDGGDAGDGGAANKAPDAHTINSVLSIAVPDYKLVMESILKKKNLLPPSGAMAGVYSLVDSQRGVWKAPANVAVSSVISPAVLIDHNQQQDLNAPILGKAVCAIRPFIGLGTMVWGARTLDANSLDWRYMNVRRTMIMLEQSIKFAAKAYVFEPNVKNTWVSIESMISNFLTNMWKQGALAGAVPADAFSVSVGLGTTMTAVDILEGIMRIEVKVAVSRPAEFIVITFEQQMQKS